MTFKQFIATDNLLHGAVSFVLAVVLTAIFKYTAHPVLIGAGVTFVIGLLKEVYDTAKGNPFSDNFADICWDIMGIGLAVFTLFRLGYGF